jgi:hypothetical protein
MADWHGRRLRFRRDAEDADRPSDVLELLLAHVLER